MLEMDAGVRQKRVEALEKIKNREINKTLNKKQRRNKKH